MGVEQNKKIAADFMRHFSEGNLEAGFKLVADDVRWRICGSSPVAGSHTKAFVREMLEQAFPLFDGPFEWTPTAFTAEGDRVAVEARSHAVTKGGHVFANYYHLLFIIRNGKIVEAIELFEEAPQLAMFAALAAENEALATNYSS